jgi:peptidyl-prolyl cis-trans isomerase SurA
MLRNSFSPITCLAIFYSLSATAQSADPILFTVQNKPVYVSEFNYIYSKNNQEKADYSEASLKDYLDLYVRFKLKVQKARDMKLDTLGVLKSELEGYRKQLAKSYLEDREVTDKLVHEAFERMQQDINISHIFTAVDRNASPADTLAAFLKSNNIARTLRNGGNFDQIAADSSDEKTARTNKGKIGFITAMLPDGYYALEKAIYAAKPGDIVGPVRTNVGYHVVRVEAFRPARGEMEVGQILLRKSEDATKNSLVKLRIDSVYQALSNGAKWEELCLKYTEDKTNAAKGGYIGFFGINRYQPSFEEAAFALKNDGAYSAPTETTIGWHIIKRLSARPVNTFDTMKRALTEKVKRDSRSEMARQSMIRRIKSESRFQELPQNLVKTTNRHHLPYLQVEAKSRKT